MIRPSQSITNRRILFNNHLHLSLCDTDPDERVAVDVDDRVFDRIEHRCDACDMRAAQHRC